MARHISLLVYRDFQLLDAAGPLAAFEIAERYRPGAYTLRIVAAEAGLITSSCGVSVQAARRRLAPTIDTLIIVGGNGSRSASENLSTRRWVSTGAKSARRIATVCSGAYILAMAGLLDGKSVTTHWSLTRDFASKFPAVRLEPDRIFVRDGKFWSSAGITAGIDLALAMIADDLGELVARQTAQQLVVYYQRPGGQSQFSALLDLERANGRFAALLDYVRCNLGKRLGVDELARFCHMSPRHFSREFHTEVGVSPAKTVERLRIDAARVALESGSQSIQGIAQRCGFGTTDRMRRSFVRALGNSPSILKRAGRSNR